MHLSVPTAIGLILFVMSFSKNRSFKAQVHLFGHGLITFIAGGVFWAVAWSIEAPPRMGYSHEIWLPLIGLYVIIEVVVLAVIGGNKKRKPFFDEHPD